MHVNEALLFELVNLYNLHLIEKDGDTKSIIIMRPQELNLTFSGSSSVS